MRLSTILSAVLAVLSGAACAQTPVIRWDVETGRPVPQPQNLTIRRGEAVNLQPRFLSYGVPMAISTGALVEWRNGPTNSGSLSYITNTVAATVFGTSDVGRVSVPWGPWCEPTTDVSRYEIAISGTMIRAYGTLTALSGVGDPGGGVWPTGQVSASAYALLNPRLTAVEATVSGIGTGSVDLIARASIATHTGRVDNPHAVTAAQVGADAIGTATAATGTLATALRGELSAGTSAVYAASGADIVAATGTLAGVLRGETAAATGAVASALRSDISAATNANYNNLTNWVAAQGYGTGGESDGGATNIAAGDADGYDPDTRTLTWNTNAAAGGGSDYVLPSALTGTSYSLIYADTNVLLLSHASPGAGYDMSGTYTWGTSDQHPDGAYIKDVSASVIVWSGTWSVYDEGAEPADYWTNGTSCPIGTYNAVPGAEGVITASHPITQTNVVITGAGGRMLSADYINGTPAATIIAGAARGAMAVTNGQTGVTLGGMFTGNGVGLTNIQFIGTGKLYLGTDTNAPWVMGLGTTNIQFGAGTNRAIFGSPW